MSTNLRHYRGFEIYPLVYPHKIAQAGSPHNYDEGFDASVRICEPATNTTHMRSRVFRVPGKRPFDCAGDARRASTIYAEQLIDASSTGPSVWDLQ